MTQSQVSHSRVGEAVNEEEKIDSTRDHREPGASGLPGDESLPKVEGTANPENLAGIEHHEDDVYGHFTACKLVGVDEREDTKSKDQQKNDHAPMSDDALINCAETDHRRATRAR